MWATVLLFVGGALLLASYFTVGKWLDRNVLQPDPNKQTTAVRKQKENPIDFNPVNKWILYAYSFPSIAAIGPITGPTLGAMFGWLPITLFIVIGNITLGAVQDFFGLSISERFEAKTVMGISGDLIAKRSSRAFYFMFFYGVISVAFMKMLATLMGAYPQTGTVLIYWIFVSVLFGAMVSRMRVKLQYAVPICIGLASLSLWVTFLYPVDFKGYFISTGMIAKDATYWTEFIWLIFINVYAFIGAFLPYDFLIEPRQHLTMYFLWGLMIIGVLSFAIAPRAIGAGWPAIQWLAMEDLAGVTAVRVYQGNMWLWPMLFTLVLCGAISVHSTIHSTTTVCMLSNEEHILIGGYGAMNSEGFQGLFSAMVIVQLPYKTFATQLAAGGPLGAFNYGFGTLFTTFGIPLELGIAIGALWCLVTVTDMDNGRRGYAWALAEAMHWDMAKRKYRLFGIGFHTVLQVFFTTVLGLEFLLALFGGINRGYAALFAGVFLIWLMKLNKRTWYMWGHVLFLLPTSFVAMILLLWRDVGGLLTGKHLITGVAVKVTTETMITGVAAAVSAIVINTLFVIIMFDFLKAWKREKAAQAALRAAPPPKHEGMKM